MLSDSPQETPTLRWGGICIDCHDADEMAEFYSALLGWEIVARDTPATRAGGSGWVALRDPDGHIGMSFQAEDWYEPPVWPEQSGSQTKMAHLEIGVDDLDAAVAFAVDLGGRIAPHQPPDRRGELCVMLDPAGHPFCLCL